MKLVINDLRLWVHLGCSSEERLHKQLVAVHIDILFDRNFDAINTDDINDTICYASLVNKIQKKCQNIEFNLIEKLNKFIYNTTLQFVDNNRRFSVASIKVMVSKLRIPVPGIYGSVDFIYEN